MLTHREARLLQALEGEPSRVFTKEELMALFPAWAPSHRQLDNLAANLRRKLAGEGRDGLVVNCWGIGYRLNL